MQGQTVRILESAGTVVSLSSTLPAMAAQIIWVYVSPNKTLFTKTKIIEGWGDGLVVMITDCFSREPKLRKSSFRVSDPSSGLLAHRVPMWCTDKPADKPRIHPQ